jgi:hypothetical protein
MEIVINETVVNPTINIEENITTPTITIEEVVYNPQLNIEENVFEVCIEIIEMQMPGKSFQETFETVSKNLKGNPYALNYTSGKLTSIVYTLSNGTITKTLNYTGEKLTSIVLSGDTPAGINLTKTLSYTGDTLTSITYS